MRHKNSSLQNPVYFRSDFIKIRRISNISVSNAGQTSNPMGDRGSRIHKRRIFLDDFPLFNPNKGDLGNPAAITVSSVGFNVDENCGSIKQNYCGG